MRLRNSSLVPIVALVVGVIVTVLLVSSPMSSANGLDGVAMVLTGIGGIAFAALLLSVVLGWMAPRG